MPPFSGKKKKEQLKAKRAKKREQNERERAYESAQDALAEADYRGEDSIAVAEPVHEAQAKNNTTTTTTKEEEGEYKYGADRAGVRSVFKKESAAAIAARKQASYEPLRERQVMPETGIAYGAWFHMPHVAICKGNHDEASATFPVSLELPSRGWEPIAMDAQGKQVIRLVGEHNNSSSEGDDDEEKEEENESDDGQHSEEKEEDDVPREEKTRHVTAAEIEAIETRRFARYVHTIEHTYTTTDVAEGDEERQAAGLGSVLSSYERNLEVWRQLWRTVEVSEVIVLVMDVRYPIVHLHLGLLAYVLKEQRKPCVLLLNKIDLVPQPVVERWLAFIPAYLQNLGLMNKANHSSSSSDDDDDGTGEELPEVVLRTFTANPRPETASGAESTLDVTRRQRKARRRRGKMYEQLRAGTMRVPNAQRAATRERRNEDSDGSSADEEEEESEEVEEEETYGPHVQFKGMDKAVQEMQKDKQVHRELRAVAGNITELLTRCKAMAARQRSVASPLSPPQRQATLQPHTNTTHMNDDAVVVVEDDDAAFTHIGFVGFPNVGKSSLLNCIRGTKVVSVSATPGHTKHLQTIPLPEDEVTLVDSPGLALPMRGVPIPLQAVIGTHQIAQTRDPQSGVAYLAMHLPLEKLYGLRRPGGAGRQDEEPWSAYELCEAYAQKRGFFVKHGKGALDIHRASIALLQEAYEGRLVLFFAAPPRTLLETAVFARSIRPYLLQSVLGTS